MINWADIDAVFLDMDGTLLDLHFDNFFWLEYVPEAYAKKEGKTVEEVKPYLLMLMKKAEGTLDWYCLDYWTRLLEIDIVSLKREIDHLIEMRPQAQAFLEALHASDKRVYLMTNAHHDAIDLKVEKALSSHYFDDLVTSHQFGHAKESQAFWHCLEEALDYDPARTLFIDDSKHVLESARQYGIGHLLWVSRPDMRKPARHDDDFPMLHNFEDIMAGL